MASVGGRGCSLLYLFLPSYGGGNGIANFTLDAATDAMEFRFGMPGGYAGGALTRLGFRQGAITGTSPVYRVSLQGMGATGFPDGTIKGAGNACYYDYTPIAGNNSTWQWVTMGVTYTPVAGEALCMVIQRISGTIDASNKCTFGATFGNQNCSNGLPQAIQNDAGSRTLQTHFPSFAVGTATEVYGCPLETQYTAALNSTTTPDELAMKFTLPAGWGSTFTVPGYSLQLGASVSASGTSTIKLYDSDASTVLQSVVLDHDILVLNGQYEFLPFDETSLSTLNFGSVYYISVCPDGAVNCSPTGFAVDTAADLDAYPLGQLCHAASRTDAGSWSNLLTTRFGIAPVIGDWSEPTGGGGGTKRRRF